ncbi:hypothetical protein JMUB7504_27420 [Staphylococcus aureus]
MIEIETIFDTTLVVMIQMKKLLIMLDEGTDIILSCNLINDKARIKLSED